MPTSTSTSTSTSDSSQPTQQPKSDTMPPPTSPSTIPLTLILAATPSLGIGRAGGLPWPMLKKEMAWFARVTKRVASSPTSPQSSSDVATAQKINAVIMGRKTWDSIPPRFRPLKDRLNVVVTRDVSGFRAANNLSKDGDEVEGGKEGPVVVGSLPAAIEALRSEGGRQVSRAWVIGGASIYAEALGLKETNRVVLTKIKREYECDAFFAVDLEGGEGGWRRVGRRALEEWVGEEVPEGEVVEGDVAFEFCLFERD
ncbi:hypothetical protein BU24DRAFT_491555 [Aaosphaeria arxii CBS 175.79]|uniref:Dihydrofolate reductase n=1 Tax=Aaosphaeria arxii CBS 175.79 TaxID=1450172 RepID=A0A6A5XRA8_9PLEO|nr:uncharacterized protein BU24DRAFT_491555 [Aaosphaeria arxii CBS 175.79]KAF2015291.1 hypothetical protein BU24DRAFT_491555 [Aaosphaeria arxii CBS 175.79]